MTPAFASAAVAETPFPHARVPAILGSSEADAVLAWLEEDAPWRLRIESFYEQYEFSLLADGRPQALAALTDAAFVGKLRAFLMDHFEPVAALDLVDITAHKLMPGQTIRVHNDFIGAEETHRILIQLNRGWSVDNGGLLMLFGSERPEDVRAAILPVHGSGFAFEISPHSYHAVSTIHAGCRYTLVYTFRRAD